MKVNPEYLSFATHQSNGGMFLLVLGGVVLMIALCVSIMAVVQSQDGLLAAFFLAIGAFMAVAAFGVGCSINNQIKGNIQDIETSTGAQIISIDDTNVSSDSHSDNVSSDSHGDIVIGRNDAQVNLTKNVSYIKDGKVYTNGVIIITQGKAGLFNNEKELKPILAKK